MNRPTYLISLFFAGTIIFGGCARHNSEHSHEHGHEHTEHEHEHHHEHEGHAEKNSEEIVLNPETASRFGVETDTVRLSDFHEVIKSTGLIMSDGTETGMVVAPKSGTVHFRNLVLGSNVPKGAVIAVIETGKVSGGDSNAGAKALLETTKAEFKRISDLYDSRLVTAGEYYAAKAAYEQAQAAYSPTASSGSATAPISGILTGLLVSEGQFVDAGTPVASVASSKNVTLKVDVPRKYAALLNTIDNMIINLPASETTIDIKSAGGRKVTSTAVPGSSGASAYIPVYFSAPNNGSLVPGSTFTAYLTGNPRSGVITLPIQALSEQQGQFYVYERLDDECYAKRLVKTGASDGNRIEIISGLEPGNIVVTDGVKTVRLAEAGAAIPEGHTHNH